MVLVESMELPLGAAVPFVPGEEARLTVEAEVLTLFEDLRFEPTKFLKREFMDDMYTCARTSWRKEGGTYPGSGGADV